MRSPAVLTVCVVLALLTGVSRFYARSLTQQRLLDLLFLVSSVASIALLARLLIRRFHALSERDFSRLTRPRQDDEAP